VSVNSDRQQRELPHRVVAPTWGRLVDESRALDQALYGAVAATRTPTLDSWFARLSEAANYSRLWLVIAGSLAVVGGQRGRRAALRGLVAIALTSAITNVAVKPVVGRTRPPRSAHPRGGRVRVPVTDSFPSGHSASAFAFAFAVAPDHLLLALGALSLASAVGYSRIHTGVHYPGDVLAGALLGSVVGMTVCKIMDRDRRSAEPS
jgi:membrane-associated phospholipid phosphatase